MTDVNFKVIKIEKAIKHGCVIVTLKFEGSDKEYTYIRKAYNNTTVIDGCRIYFNANYQVEKVEREYETKGVKKMSTAKQVGTTSTKIKSEIESKSIELPKVQIPEVKGEVHHDRYDEIKCCLECNIPVYLAGPAGSGKITQLSRLQKSLGGIFTSVIQSNKNINLQDSLMQVVTSTKQNSIKLALMKMNVFSSLMKWMLQFLKFWFFLMQQLPMVTLNFLMVELILIMYIL